MTDRRPPEKDGSQGNLGQKVAEQEKKSDCELEHMGDDVFHPSDKQKERKDKTQKDKTKSR